MLMGGLIRLVGWIICLVKMLLVFFIFYEFGVVEIVMDCGCMVFYFLKCSG